jgi:hypothetical protein
MDAHTAHAATGHVAKLQSLWWYALADGPACAGDTLLLPPDTGAEYGMDEGV